MGESCHAQVGGSTDGDLVHFCELGVGPGEAGFQPLRFPEPAVGLGLLDTFDEVVTDLDHLGPGFGVGAQQPGIGWIPSGPALTIRSRTLDSVVSDQLASRWCP